MVRIFTLFFLLIIGHSFVHPLVAAEVLAVYPKKNHVVISQDSDHTWRNDDSVCFTRHERQIACGKIIKSQKKSSLVEIESSEQAIKRKTIHDSPTYTFLELEFEKAPVKKGDTATYTGSENRGLSSTAQLPPPENSGVSPLLGISEDTKKSNERVGQEDLLFTTTENRDPAATESSNDTFGRGGDPRPLSNILAGLDYIFPNVQYQQSVSNHFAVGITAMYMSAPIGSGSLSALGGYLTLNYYSQKSFTGIWAQFGAGYYSESLTLNGNSDSLSTPAAIAVVGWRFLWDSGLNFGFGVGAQYLTQAKTANVDLGFSGLLPVISMDLGFAF
jgi:hypothetical protein